MTRHVFLSCIFLSPFFTWKKMFPPHRHFVKSNKTNRAGFKNKKFPFFFNSLLNRSRVKRESTTNEETKVATGLFFFSSKGKSVRAPLLFFFLVVENNSHHHPPRHYVKGISFHVVVSHLVQSTVMWNPIYYELELAPSVQEE